MSGLVQPPQEIPANQIHGLCSGIGKERKAYTGAESNSGEIQSINNPLKSQESYSGKHHGLSIPAGLCGALVSWDPID